MSKNFKNIGDAVKQLDPDNTIREYSKQISELFWDSLSQESDRAVVIIVGCLLDNLLEKLISAYYVKEPKVKDLFKNDHILQAFFAKINIAFFSGLISNFIYHDLLTICKIRNKFAHEVAADLSFTHRAISQLINSCELRPKDIDDVTKAELDDILAQRIKFVIIVQQIIVNLCYTEQLLLRKRPPYPVELFKLDKLPYGEMALTKSQIFQIMHSQTKR